MNDLQLKKKIGSVRPSPLSSVMGIVAGVAGLIFGIFFLASMGNDPEGAGMRGAFFVIWFLACIGGIIYSLMNLATYSKTDKKKIPLTAEDVVEMGPEEGRSEAEDFETRLRKVESLRKDGIINEEEYEQKRREILNEKW